MTINIEKFIGDETKLPLEHRIFNIMLLISLLVCGWSSITNYLLGLGEFLVWTCLLSSGVFLIIYLLFNKRNYYYYYGCVFAYFAVVTLVTVIMWLYNGGTMGTIPLYMNLLVPVTVTLFHGYRRLAAGVFFIIIAQLLIILEYNNPSLIIGYTSNFERYVDVSLALITTMATNGMLFIMLINQYNKERNKVKKSEENLLYLIHHDALTGVYNRRYFDSGLIALGNEPGNGVFVIDIDGLKLVNDLLGHEQGDRLLISAAKVLKESFRSKDIIARVGGDEFAVLLRGVSEKDLEEIYKRIQKNIAAENKKISGPTIPLQMSVGYSFAAKEDKTLQDLLRDADSKMYREKLTRYVHGNKTIIDRIKQVLETRACEDGQNDRLKNLIIALAREAGVPDSQMGDLSLLAKFHYVGKVGIPENILNKPGPLTVDERMEVQKHSEIGYRIAQTSSELVPIAEWLLKHHEWWDGKGYPLGIGQESIPLPCRILAIVDAFDAMTSNRPYRPAMDCQAALGELKRCAGTQFDPSLVDLFINLQNKVEPPE